jgi:hypothetical protein
MDASLAETGPDAPGDADAGPCTQPLGTFHCPSVYPAMLSAVCADANLSTNLPVSTATCSSLPVVVISWMPHYYFCVYDGVDAGALVGAEAISDIDEFCNGTAYIETGGQVPATCLSEVISQVGGSISGQSDASTTVVCDGG